MACSSLSPPWTSWRWEWHKLCNKLYPTIGCDMNLYHVQQSLNYIMPIHRMWSLSFALRCCSKIAPEFNLALLKMFFSSFYLWRPLKSAKMEAFPLMLLRTNLSFHTQVVRTSPHPTKQSRSQPCTAPSLVAVRVLAPGAAPLWGPHKGLICFSK